MKPTTSESAVTGVLRLLEGCKLSMGSPQDTSETAQALMYLERLQELVPQCPKDKKTSKLEVIQAVIDYIYDLEEVLASPIEEEQHDEDHDDDDVFVKEDSDLNEEESSHTEDDDDDEKNDLDQSA